MHYDNMSMDIPPEQSLDVRDRFDERLESTWNPILKIS
jgi:hypothetical protein